MEMRSSTARRRAWIDSTRKLSTQEDPITLPWQSSCASFAADDDVFTAGCLTGKIETWLEDCRSDGSTENTGRSFEFRSNNSSEELCLGFDAAELETQDLRSGSGCVRRTFRLPSLNLGNSFASSCNSANTLGTVSSVSEVLHLCSENAETTLYELGFGCDEPQVAVRIPPRFFTFPSQAKGINFRLFLDSQLQRIREEDPSLCIASRFRQVQALTETANAFYSLYSHVSRTPVQKLATPEFTFPSSPLERMERFRSSVRSEPRSPAERLKDTVSKMCLYTKSPHGSESCTPQASPQKRSSLSDFVEVVLDKSQTRAAKRLDLNFDDNDADIDRNSEDDESFLDTGNSGESLSLSGETVKDMNLSQSRNQRIPVARVAQDVICRQIVETVHQEPFCCMHASNMRDTASSSRSLEKESQVPQQNNAKESHDIPEKLLPVQAWIGGSTGCSIFVTDEGQILPQCRSAASGDSLVQTCQESSAAGKIHYLNPPEHGTLRPNPDHLQQVNSFELEEVNSAGEEEFGLSGIRRLLPRKQHGGKVTRGDSAHSDSSGYEDEDASHINRRPHDDDDDDELTLT
ncbi:protein TESPA1 [Synchiropus splendidus]|uniref:protein TESPA1 n=1 Tax=Synchiropus splendidus TaxID=270530 RepID=UPI00237DA0AB|nr:protein TESPA1 [Synchiropus splendidus]